MSFILIDDIMNLIMWWEKDNMYEQTTKCPLLINGEANNPGFAKELFWEYQKEAIKAPKWKIKEWDYYLITNDDMGVALTMDNNSYMGLMSMSLLDFKNRKEKTVSKIIPLTFDKIKFPETSETGDIYYEDKNCRFSFKNDHGKRILEATMYKFINDINVRVEVVIDRTPKESMVILTPFDKKYHFYYNQKIVGMEARVKINYGAKLIEMKKAFATLDWGRGVWTYDNTWIWGSANILLDNHKFGFNIGYGFGDTSKASENMIFYDEKAHKIDRIKAIIKQKDAKDDFMAPWTITSNDKRFEMIFTPILDRAACTDIKILKSDQHQVFGYYNGYCVLDDNTKIEVKDCLGFIEKVVNKW